MFGLWFRLGWVGVVKGRVLLVSPEDAIAIAAEVYHSQKQNWRCLMNHERRRDLVPWKSLSRFD